MQWISQRCWKNFWTSKRSSKFLLEFCEHASASFFPEVQSFMKCRKLTNRGLKNYEKARRSLIYNDFLSFSTSWNTFLMLFISALSSQKIKFLGKLHIHSSPHLAPNKSCSTDLQSFSHFSRLKLKCLLTTNCGRRRVTMETLLCVTCTRWWDLNYFGVCRVVNYSSKFLHQVFAFYLYPILILLLLRLTRLHACKQWGF